MQLTTENPIQNYYDALGASRKFVLLIEDDPVSAMLQKKILENSGLDVRVEKSVSGALMAMRTISPDLVITDLAFPEDKLNGLDLLLRRSQRAQETGPKVIVVSGNNDKSTRSDVVRLGASEFIAKPFLAPAYRSAVLKNILAPHRRAENSELAVRSFPKEKEALSRSKLESGLLLLEHYLIGSLACTLIFAVYHALSSIFSDWSWFA